MLDPTTWGKRAAEDLRRLATEIEHTAAPTQVGRIALNFEALRDQAKAKIERITKATERHRAIYVIMLDGPADPEAFCDAFYKERKSRTLSLPQSNGIQRDADGNALRVIYVGSSCWSSTKDESKPRTGTLRARLTEHLMGGYKGTYALHLGHWASKLSGGIIVDIYNYPAETSRDVVVAVEDALSQELKPICGRRGIQR